MRKDFNYRLMVLLFLALSTVFVLATIALLPAYFLSVVKNKSANNKLELQKDIPLPVFDDETNASVTDLNQKLDLVESAQKKYFPVSEKVISVVLAKKLPGIKIQQIGYINDPVKGKIINIAGTAPSRNTLLLFRKAFESDASFTNVNLPISNFVKGTDIEFHLTLTAK